MIYRCIATLCVYSSSLTVEDMTRALGQSPTRRVDKGSPVTSRGRVVKLREKSAWFLNSPLAKSQPVESHIKYLAAFASEKEAALRSLASECDLVVDVAFHTNDNNGGFMVDVETLSILGRLNIPLSVSFIGNEDADNEGQ
jgi:Domain of unknown function (DUF4279)